MFIYVEVAEKCISACNMRLCKDAYQTSSVCILMPDSGNVFRATIFFFFLMKHGNPNKVNKSPSSSTAEIKARLNS